jgi:anti-sigma factor RsiW
MKTRPKKPPKRCLRLFARLSQFLDGELSAKECSEIRKHLEGCSNCCSFLRTLEKTVDLCRQYRPADLPAPLKAQARAELLAAFRQGKRGRVIRP